MEKFIKKLKNLYISTVVVAAGKGSRMNLDISKQYIEIYGIPVLARALSVFEECGLIDEIVLVVNENDIVFCKQNIVDFFGFDKVKALVAGGSERQHSVYNGLLQVNKNADIVIIHDGARPFIKEKHLIECIQAADKFGASGVGVRVKDTVKRVNDKGMVVRTVDRTNLWAIQTPQVFKYGLIIEAHKKALQDGFLATDDVMLVERLDKEVKMVEGSYDNIKITTQEDLAVAEAIAAKFDGAGQD
ncbi:MAG: 2-C-methyl-D-erythritol 4-phosphate cytidylyltransferase [Acetivibrionales bacterium]|jgi:2-C-methyl-D-erythritol 4-phosphate cytidylyltransferase